MLSITVWDEIPCIFHDIIIHFIVFNIYIYTSVFYSISAGNNVEIFLKPGEMDLYESAVVPHGRQFPFNGDFFDNLFVHYALKDGDFYIK